MARSLEGHVALVTGSTGEGMGRSTALTLAREGADVALNYGTNRKPDRTRLRRLMEAIERYDVRVIVVSADTTRLADVRRMFARTKAELGAVHILVNNAGGAWAPENLDIAQVDPVFWRRVLRAEIDGMFHTIQAALPDMRRRRWGRIVNLGMERSEEFMEPPYDYAVGKIARHGLTRILSSIEIERGITINAIAPGYIPALTFREALQAVRHEGPWKARGHGTPQDVAELVAFLCREEARYINGAVIPVHGAPE